jgi:hypothetical protein
MPDVSESRPKRTLYEGTLSRPLAAPGESSPPLGLAFRQEARLPPGHQPAPVGRLYVVKLTLDDYGRVVEDGGGVIEKTFADASLAEEYLRRRIHGWQQRWLQEPWFEVARMSSLTPGLLRDLVMDLGLEPPPPEAVEDDEAWLAWWKATAPLANDWQRERFLDALLDRSACFRVFTVDLVE